jgi:Protein of unknown function (DUF2905)
VRDSSIHAVGGIFGLKLMADLGKGLMVAGALIFVAGLAFVLLGRAHVPLGRLPGDIVYRSKNTIFYFPVTTSILVSVLLSLVLYLIGRFR